MNKINVSEAIRLIASTQKKSGKQLMFLTDTLQSRNALEAALKSLPEVAKFSFVPETNVNEATKAVLIVVPSWDSSFDNAQNLAAQHELDMIVVGWAGDMNSGNFPAMDEFDVYLCNNERALTVGDLIKNLETVDANSIVVYEKRTGELYFAQGHTVGWVILEPTPSVEMDISSFPAITVAQLLESLRSLPHTAKVETRIGWPLYVKEFKNVTIIECESAEEGCDCYLRIALRH